MSKGAKELLEIVQKIFPNQRIELEYNIAARGALFLDLYLPRLKLAFEFDGDQHGRFVEHFHKDRQGFINARKRDFEKERLCEEQGITLIRIKYGEEMTLITVSKKIDEALRRSE